MVVIKGHYLGYKIVFLKAGFIPERGLAGFPQFGKNMPHKISVAASNGARKKKKNRPKDKNLFVLNKIFENITDNKLLRPRFYSCPECSKMVAKRQ